MKLIYMDGQGDTSLKGHHWEKLKGTAIIFLIYPMSSVMEPFPDLSCSCWVMFQKPEISLPGMVTNSK